MNSPLSEQNRALKPCPFCGTVADLGVAPEVGDWPRGYFGVCPACRASTAMSSDRDEAIRTWNTRPTPEPPEDVAGLVEELRADMTRALPGVMDDATYGQIEDALDLADAPIREHGETGRFLKLHERVAALGAALTAESLARQEVERERDAAREALRPFAQAAINMARLGDNWPVECGDETLQVADFRRARSLLSAP
jgi:hypothetical protein